MNFAVYPFMDQKGNPGGSGKPVSGLEGQPEYLEGQPGSFGGGAAKGSGRLAMGSRCTIWHIQICLALNINNTPACIGHWSLGVGEITAQNERGMKQQL